MQVRIKDGRVAFPFSVEIDSTSGKIDGEVNHIERYLSDLVNVFAEPDAAENLLRKKGDILVYEVYEKRVPEANGEVRFCSSITYPGKIGDEYFMTKGHFHSRPDAAEIYYCIRGRGYMLMEKKDGEHELEEMHPGRVVYVPGYYAHRSINTGDGPLISLPVYPGDAGHDYGTMEERGFKHIVVEKNGNPVVIENPRYGRMGR